MSFGRNDLVTRAYVESMIEHANRGIRKQAKDLQEQINQFDIDFAGLHELIKKLENGNSDTEQRLKELIEKFSNNEFVTGVIQSESGTRLSTCQDSLVNDESLNFVASALRLPTAINQLILEILNYVLAGKQD